VGCPLSVAGSEGHPEGIQARAPDLGPDHLDQVDRREVRFTRSL
jgi:hypothetical protein